MGGVLGKPSTHVGDFVVSVSFIGDVLGKLAVCDVSSRRDTSGFVLVGLGVVYCWGESVVS